MALSDLIDNTFQTPVIECHVGGRRVTPLSVSVDHGFDTVNGTATVEMAEVPSWLQFRQIVHARAGFGGFTHPIFAGWVEDDGRGYFPFNNTIKASGPLRYAQFQYPTTLTYSSQTGEDIVEDLVAKAGIALYDINGSAQTFGTVQDVVLEAGQAPFELINRLDQVEGYSTFDVVGAVRRRKVSGIPAANVKWSYVQGTNIFRISRPRTVRGIHNQVVVTGLPQDSGTPSSTWQADNPLVPNPPQYISYDFRSDLIEDNTYASTVAERLLSELNRVREEIRLSVPGNPYLYPGDTVGLTAAKIGIDSETPFWVQHVAHRIDERGFMTELTLVGGVGPEGYPVPGDGSGGTPGSGNPAVDPTANIVYRITAENFDAGSGAADMVTVNADGSGSSDADSAPGSLTYSWSNSANADTGTDPTYSTSFTQAQWDAGPSITLQVTDGDGNTDSVTIPLSDADTPVLNRNLYVAASSQAQASPDGGRTWNTWSPGSGTVEQTPEIALESASYFGLNDGKLYRTEDYLATAPALVHDFGSQINAIWVNEVDGDRVTVGLSNGEIWRTLDSGTSWTELIDYATAVLHLIESARNPGEYRVALADGTIRRTFDDFANTETVHTFDTAAWISTLSNFNNYFGGEDSGGEPVIREDGTVLTFTGGTVTNVWRAMTHHIRDDILWCADLSGSDVRVWRKPAASTAFAQVATITGAGRPNVMMRDGDSEQVVYLATDQGLYKTTDAGDTWYEMRDYSAAGLDGNAIGYGSAPWQAVEGKAIVSSTSAKAYDLWNGSGNDSPPDGWRDVGYDDSGWPSAVIISSSAEVTGTDPIAPPNAQGNDTPREALIRHQFTLTSGIVQQVTLEMEIEDNLLGVWINNTFVHEDSEVKGFNVWTSTGILTINPTLCVAGPNLLALHFRNDIHDTFSASYKLEIA